MKILIIHQHFRTPEQGGALRSFYIARELHKLGHEVHVLTALPNADSFIKKLEGIHIRYLKVRYDNDFGFLRRIIAYSTFVIKSIFVLRFYKTCDIIYAMSTPLSVGIIALFCKGYLSKPYAFEVGDLWPDVPIQMGIIKNVFLKWVTLKLELIIYKKANFVVALSKPMKDLIQKKIDDVRIIVIENFSDNEFFKSSEADFPPKSISNKSFVIGYIGTLGVANKVGKLIYLAEQLKADDIHFVIQGNGKEKHQCLKLVDDYSLSNVQLVPFGTRDEVKQTLNNCDAIFVCFDSRFPLITTGCPNKLMDGFASGKIILMNYDGWQRELIESAECGFYINTENIKESAETLRRMIHNPDLIKKLKNNSRLVSKSYSIEKLVGYLNAALNSKNTTSLVYNQSH